MPRPTLRGVATIGALLTVVTSAIVTGTPELAPLAVVIGIPVVLAPWLARRRARQALAFGELHSHVEPAATEVGSAMSLVLYVSNRGDRGTVVPRLGLPHTGKRWRPRGDDRLAGRTPRLAPPAAGVVPLPGPEPGTTGSCRVPVPTGRRGVLELPPLRCWAHDPLGLFGCPGPLTPAATAVVHPVPLDPGQPTTGVVAARAGGDPAGSPGSGGGLGELEGIRPYVLGDRLSLLHWPAKARYGTWFVRQFGTDGSSVVRLVLDDRAGVHRRAEFERLLSVTLWTLDEAMEGGCPVHLVTLTGRSISVEPTARGRAGACLALAELRPSAAPPPGSRRWARARYCSPPEPGRNACLRRRARHRHRRPRRTVAGMSDRSSGQPGWSSCERPVGCRVRHVRGGHGGRLRR